MEIRSFRRVFQLERRVYRIDRLRLNPGGVPVRGLVYFVVLTIACVLVARLPLAGFVFSLAPWYLRDLAAPAIGAALLAVLRVDGRPGHLAALAIVRYRLRPRLLVAGRPRTRDRRRWSPQEIVLLPDGGESGVRRMRYRGPGAAVIAIEHERVLIGGRSPGRGIHLALAAGPQPRRPRSRRVVLLPRRCRLELGRRGPARAR